MDIQQELSEAEREIVANRLLAEQRDRFDGVRKAAYTAAGVNPATWARATSGLRVRPDRLVQIVKALWPESHGHWDSVPAEKWPFEAWPAEPKNIEHGPWSGQIENAMADVDGRFVDLERRVRDIEQQIAELTHPDLDDPVTADEEAGPITPQQQPQSTTDQRP